MELGLELDLDSEEVLDLEPEPDPDLPDFAGFLEDEDEEKKLIMGRVQTSVTLCTLDGNCYLSLGPLYGEFGQR